jgi:hypothetical protein
MRKIDFESENMILIFCFLLIEYVKETDPKLFEKAHSYAKDHTGVDVTNFEIDLEDIDDLEDAEEENEEDFEDEENEEDED